MNIIHKQTGAFVALIALSMLLGWRTLLDTFALALRNDEYTYILLILPICAILIYLERRSLRMNAKTNLPLGIALIGSAILIAAYACVPTSWLGSDVQMATQMFALVLSWIGVFLLRCGIKALRIVLFPSLFLFALVPFPRFVLSIRSNWPVSAALMRK